jgi:hypothetical protein
MASMRWGNSSVRSILRAADSVYNGGMAPPEFSPPVGDLFAG